MGDDGRTGATGLGTALLRKRAQPSRGGTRRYPPFTPAGELPVEGGRATCQGDVTVVCRSDNSPPRPALVQFGRVDLTEFDSGGLPGGASCRLGATFVCRDGDSFPIRSEWIHFMFINMGGVMG
jgi:hypothetical protein